MELLTGKYMTRPGYTLVIFSAMAFHATTPATRSLLNAVCCAGLLAGMTADWGKAVKTMPCTPLPGASMVATARSSSAVYFAGWCSAFGVVGPYWSQLHDATISWARVWRMRFGSDVGQFDALTRP